MRYRLSIYQPVLALALIAAPTLRAGAQADTGAGQAHPFPCTPRDFGWHRGIPYCVVREAAVLVRDGLVAIDVPGDGDVAVAAWDGQDVRVRVLAAGWATSDTAAARVASLVGLDTGRTIRPRYRGPDRSTDPARPYWSATLAIEVPRHANVRVSTANGRIRVAGVVGDISFQSRNGSVELVGVGGRVEGNTNSGNVRVALTGDTWAGSGLDVRTNFGLATLEVPPRYSGQIDVGTNWGKVESEIPATVRSSGWGRRLTATLGDGGALVRLTTNSGTARVRARGRQDTEPERRDQ